MVVVKKHSLTIPDSNLTQDTDDRACDFAVHMNFHIRASYQSENMNYSARAWKTPQTQESSDFFPLPNRNSVPTYNKIVSDSCHHPSKAMLSSTTCGRFRSQLVAHEHDGPSSSRTRPFLQSLMKANQTPIPCGHTVRSSYQS